MNTLALNNIAEHFHHQVQDAHLFQADHIPKVIAFWVAKQDSPNNKGLESYRVWPLTTVEGS